jgi:hypothetical protein
MNDPMSRTWDWRVLAVECPSCGASMSPDAAITHASWHWLTNTQPTEIPTA